MFGGALLGDGKYRQLDLDLPSRICVYRKHYPDAIRTSELMDPWRFNDGVEHQYQTVTSQKRKRSSAVLTVVPDHTGMSMKH